MQASVFKPVERRLEAAVKEDERKKRATVCRSLVVPSNREARGPAIKASWKLNFPPPLYRFLWVWVEAL